MRTTLALLLLAAPPLAAADSVERYEIYERAFQATSEPANPYREITASATLVRPDGSTWQVPLFWDGGAVWKLRFSPDALGPWSYRTSSNDRRLNAQSGGFQVVATTRPGGLTVNPAARSHFARQNGEPVWFLGDTAWGYFIDSDEEKFDRAAAQRYAAARAAQGFNAIHAMLLFEQGSGNRGGAPFAALETETLNPAYFQEVDRRIAYANGQGLSVGLALAWGDKGREERYPWRRFPDLEARRRYARYIAARYSAYDVYFLVSGEWHAEIQARGVAAAAVYQEMVELGEALKAAEPHGRLVGIHPMTAHGSVREFRAAAWMSFADYQQNYSELHARALLSRSAAAPVVNSEYGYLLRDANGDGVTDKQNSYSTADLRFASWDIAMAGAYLVTGFGTTYFAGYRDPGPFDLEAAKNRAWEAQAGHLRRFFESTRFTALTPADALLDCAVPRGADRRERLPLAGGGFHEALRPPERTWWALADFDRQYVVYVRGVTAPLTLSLGARPGAFEVRWFDPREGVFLPAQMVEIAGAHELTPPDAQDWVALLVRRP